MQLSIPIIFSFLELLIAIFQLRFRLPTVILQEIFSQPQWWPISPKAIFVLTQLRFSALLKGHGLTLAAELRQLPLLSDAATLRQQVGQIILVQGADVLSHLSSL